MEKEHVHLFTNADQTECADASCPGIGKEPFLWLETGEPGAYATCGCLLESDKDGTGDPAFTMCAKHAAAETLLEYLKEAHAPEIENNHGGDDPASCSYCRIIREAEGA